MKRSGGQEIPPVLDRYEIKYTIPLALVDRISDFIKPYCSLDMYSEREEGLFYKVNSLYFDSPSFFFLQQRQDRSPDRFEMRVRAYGDAPQLPYFLEIKQKKDNTVRKYRAKVFNGDIKGVLFGPDRDCGCDEPQDAANANRFRRMMYTYNAQPQVLIQYLRKAYVSTCDDYARVTFDKEVRFCRANGYLPLPVEEELRNCDTETCFDQGCSVVMELKCYTRFVPVWMIDLVRRFELKHRSFSKYSTSMRPMFERYRIGSRAQARSSPGYFARGKKNICQ